MKKKIKKIKIEKQKGVLESPLFVSILHLIPSILLLAGVALGIFNLYQKVKSERKVLGAETNLPERETETIKQRLDQLQEAAKTINSEQLRVEIDKLTVK